MRSLRDEVRAEEAEPGEDAPLYAAFLRYVHALERGDVVDRQAYLSQHAAEAPGLGALLEGLDWLEAQLRDVEDG